jgi:replicative DNA helicase
MLENRKVALTEADGNIRKYLLKSLLTREFYEKFKKYNLGSLYNHNIYKTVDSIYENDKELNYISTEFLVDVYEKHYGSRMGHQQLSSDKKIIFELDKVKELNNKTVEYILQLTLKKNKAEELTKKSFALVNNPDKYDFSEIKTFVKNINDIEKEYESKMDRVDIDPLRLIQEEEEEGSIKFNIPSLQNATKGVGGGNFIIIFARPEAGKSAFWISLVANKNGFAEQGKKCHAFINEEPAKKTFLRLVSCWTGVPKFEIKQKINKVRAEWSVVKENIFIYDCVGINMHDLNNYCDENEVDIVIIDQLDKVNIREKFDKQHEKLKEIYKQARELAKRKNILVIGVSQANADAHNQQRVDFNWLDNSRTGKAGEADLIIGIGKPRESVEEYERHLYLSKNKLTGDHADINCELEHTLSRYS